MAEEIKRYPEIDYLRGFAIAAMILIHTTVYFLEVPLSYIIWDYSQFAVQIFVFCSAYIFFLKKPPIAKNQVFSYFKKRVLRLLIPFYIFFAVFCSIMYLFEPKKITFEYILNSILLMNKGIDINWLVLLFIFFVFLMPLYFIFELKNKTLWFLFIGVSLLSSILFLFYKLPFDYKFLIWLPWSIMIFFAFYFHKFENSKKIIMITTISSFFIFLSSRFYLNFIHHSTQMFDNKYPPNIFLLSYGILCTTVLYVVFRQSFMNWFPIKKSLNFLSFYSYEIFFIHYIAIYIVAHIYPYKKLTWIGFIAIIFVLTVVGQNIVNLLKNTYKRKLS